MLFDYCFNSLTSTFSSVTVLVSLCKKNIGPIVKTLHSLEDTIIKTLKALEPSHYTVVFCFQTAV